VLEQPHALREAYRVVVYIDPDTKLPVRYETYDQPTPGGDPLGDLLEVCSFVNLKFNQGLPDSIFDK
jgi:outer membrane lipoprotein-sorting protein